jgi:hypothetical protein
MKRHDVNNGIVLHKSVFFLRKEESPFVNRGQYQTRLNLTNIFFLPLRAVLEVVLKFLK